jgi:hypothetical protein
MLNFLTANCTVRLRIRISVMSLYVLPHEVSLLSSS